MIQSRQVSLSIEGPKQFHQLPLCEVSRCPNPTKQITDIPDSINESVKHGGSVSHGEDTNDTLEFPFGNIGSALQDPLNEVGQLWLWTDGPSIEDWMNFP